MFQEKRPTCVTVIGWVWIVLGGLMAFSSVMGLMSYLMIEQFAQMQGHPEDFMETGIFRYFPFLAVVQFIVAVTGLISGINFLKLKAWARNVLEALTWLLLVFTVGSGVFWEYQWMSIPVEAPDNFQWFGAVMGAVIVLIYTVPLIIMLVYLRGKRVRSAISSIKRIDRDVEDV